MKSRKILFIFSILFCMANFVNAQNFQPKEVDSTLIRSIFNMDTTYSEFGYIYLNTNYNSISDKDSVIYITDYDSIYCSFVQKFEYGIIYRVKQLNCTEPKGKKVWIEFPKTDKKYLINFIEQLESLNFNWNKWNSDYTKYQPKGVGCYYSIKQTNSKSIIYFFCGC